MNCTKINTAAISLHLAVNIETLIWSETSQLGLDYSLLNPVPIF